MKVDPNTVDYYGRARRQGASADMARRFEIYAHSTLDSAGKPIACKAFLDAIDWFKSVENIVEQSHGTSAGVILQRMRKMAYPGTI
jgi:hypothetical protein